MERFATLTLASLLLFITITSLSSHSNAISYCNGPCRTLNDCAGQLICIGGRCNDDPQVGTHICLDSSPPQPPSSGTISSCNGPCKTLNDCAGQLICIGGKCADDPNVGTPICSGPP